MPGSRLALTGAAALAVVVVGLAWTRMARTPGVDYYAAWAASRAVGEGVADHPWSDAGREQMGRRAAARAFAPNASWRERSAAGTVLAANHGALPTAATPFLFAVLGTLSVGDYEADYVSFSLASLILYVTSVLWLCRQLAFPPVPSLLALSFLAGLFGPWLSGERVANVQAIQLALVAALPALMTTRRRLLGAFAAGALLAAGVAFKPNLLSISFPVLVALAVRRRLPTLAAASAGALAGAVLAFAASARFFGRWSCWRDWAGTIPELVRPPYGVATGNVALPTLLRELAGVDAAGLLLALALGALVALELATGASRGPDGDEARAELVALAGLGGLLVIWTARLAWLHYVVLTIPLLLFVLRPARGPGTAGATPLERTAGAIACAAFVPPGLPGLRMSASVRAAVLHVALLVLGVVAVRILARSRRGGSAGLSSAPGQGRVVRSSRNTYDR